MVDDVYKPPSSKLLENTPKQKSSLIAVLWGFLIDMGGTLLFTFSAAFIYAAILGFQGYGADQIDKAIRGQGLFTIYRLIQISVGLSISVYAGYICAKNNLENSTRNIIVLCTIMGAFSIAINFSQLSSIHSYILSALTFFALYLGSQRAVRKYA